MSDLAPQLNPDVWGRMDREILEAEQAATAKAQSFITQRFVEASTLGNRVVTELCSVRDEANALVTAAKSGQLSAADAIVQLTALRNDYRSLERGANEVARTAESIEAIEADPVGWADNINQQMPVIRPDFSF